ncbi:MULTISPECIES: CU044_5270 family protein [Actinosynnema]|uniref:CU044_5270 family protein n=1 Tax=Actinosynnema TaxID=40566 RepID=UPI0020A2F080|nr:CU044_5270 family protein [Actinosynnema pretiosum]MCP2094375.1 hypothetical protein [Actinosynnema pretiosum]
MTRRSWSEAELDGALEALDPGGADRDGGADAALGRARAALLDGMAGTGATRGVGVVGGRWVAGAAAVAVLVAGGLVVGPERFGGRGASAEAAEALERAAAVAVGEVDPEVGPGRYLLVTTRAWTLDTSSAGGRSFSRLSENLAETWVPADRRAEWVERRDVTGEHRWVVGTAEEAERAGAFPEEEGQPEGEWRGVCGRFHEPPPAGRVRVHGVEPVPESDWCGAGSWQQPTERWQDGLPTDVAGLHARLRADAPKDSSRGDAALLTYVADALRTGLVRKEVRALMYRVLAELPGLEVLDRAVNLDGRVGIALGLTGPFERAELIVDPATGQFIGERTVATGEGSLPSGAVTGFTSVGTAVVDGPGVRP